MKLQFTIMQILNQTEILIYVFMVGAKNLWLNIILLTAGELGDHQVEIHLGKYMKMMVSMIYM